jgi:hypothetical protein
MHSEFRLYRIMEAEEEEGGEEEEKEHPQDTVKDLG